MKKDGFTLIELLAVIVILAIIALVSVPLIVNIVAETKQSAYESSIKMIEHAAELYAAVNEDATEVTLQTLVDEGYLSSIPIDTRSDEEMIGTIFISDGIGSYSEGYHNGVHNTPSMSDNMYPVIWNGTTWEVTSIDDENWYNYNLDADIDNSSDTNKDDGTGAFTSQRWANVQVTTDDLSVGDTIAELDLNLYVWIPRYTYKLDEDNETIEIKYSYGLVDDTFFGYESHPGFTFGNEELTGIWVAKFEMSYDVTSTDTDGGTYTTDEDYLYMSRPNSTTDPASGTSVVEQLTTNIISRYISINDMFLEAREIEIENELDADSHLIKSSEWAAVAYLTEAIRDGEEVWINNQGIYDDDAVLAGLDNYFYYYRAFYTGCVEGSSNNSGADEDDVCTNTYDTEQGYKGSTTGNIYGIYDMSGGLWEYTATYINDNTDDLLTSDSALLAVVEADVKYKEVFDVSGSDREVNYDNAEGLTSGLAIHEISTAGTSSYSWYDDYSYFLESGDPTVRRGGTFNSGSSAGIFGFSQNDGEHSIYTGWRSSIVK